MPRPPVKIKKELAGKLSLYLKPNESIWQCAFKIGSKVIRKTTKERDYTKAVEAATEIYLVARVRDKEGLPTVTKSFKSVAAMAISSMQHALDAEVGKVVYKDYIEVLNKYHIPYFGKRNIDKIDYIAVAEFSKWRREQFGGNPAASTITTHNAALNRVFDAAVERGYITRSQVPLLKNDGEKAERRPSFTEEEFEKLCTHMEVWCEAGKKGLITNKRRLLRDYVQFIADTGCRPGTETDGLKWKHIRFTTQDNNYYVFITVDGKTGSRELVARHSLHATLWKHRIAIKNDPLLRPHFEEQFLFRLPDGSEVKNLEPLSKR